MELFHATSREGMEGIRAVGFAKGVVEDLPRHHSCLSSTVEGTMAAHDREWMVIVDMPAEEVHRYPYRYPNGDIVPELFVIPWKVLNSYRPFRFECLAG